MPGICADSNRFYGNPRGPTVMPYTQPICSFVCPPPCGSTAGTQYCYYRNSVTFLHLEAPWLLPLRPGPLPMTHIMIVLTSQKIGYQNPVLLAVLNALSPLQAAAPQLHASNTQPLSPPTPFTPQPPFTPNPFHAPTPFHPQPLSHPNPFTPNPFQLLSRRRAHATRTRCKQLTQKPQQPLQAPRALH